jgi:signal transduction histidine kinase
MTRAGKDAAPTEIEHPSAVPSGPPLDGSPLRERRSADRRLRETLERISAAFFAFDFDWRLIYVNQRASDLWRVPLMDRLGERLLDVSPGWVDSDFGKKVIAAAAGDGPARFDHWNRRLDRWLDVQVYASDDGVSLYIEDVTERRRQEFEQRFLADASTVLNGSLDLDVTLQNLATLCAEHLGDVCMVDSINEPGRIACTVIAHRDLEIQNRLLGFREQFPFNREAAEGPGLAFRSGQSRLYENIGHVDRDRLDAEYGRLDAFSELGFRSAIVVPMVSRSIVQGVISIVSSTAGSFKAADLTLAEELARRAGTAIDNARLYRHAQAAVAAREQFLAVVAHELRTPVTSVSGFAGLLKREADGGCDPDRIRRYVQRLSDASARLNALVEDVLDVSRIQSGQMLLRPQPFDLAELTRGVVERIADVRFNDETRITYQGPESGCKVIADDHRIEQVIVILLDNAIKYSPHDEAIAVRLAAIDAECELTVEDHGIGLPHGADQMIFEAFERAANAQEANVSGLGIGLSIARSIVERHGGSIWAKSMGEGEGTTIGFRLPAQPLDC